MKHRLLLSLLALSHGCSELSIDEPNETKLAVGEERKVELHYLRFDVTNFEQRITKEDILGFPQEVRDRMWLLDIDLTSGPTSPQLLDNSLAAIRALDPDKLGQAERNMQSLLVMTPDTANLKGTSLEELVDLAPLLGIASEQVVADLFKMDVESAFLADEDVAKTILEQVIETHPNTRTRLGPKTADNPQGIYAVTPGGLPVTLGDVVTDFESFAERYGAYFGGGEEHPGFIVGKTRSKVITEDFALTVRANANALPYKGVDLTNTHIASVNSVRSQVEDLFNFDDPNWMKIEGLVPGVPVIESLTFRVVESDAFIDGGLSPIPRGVGDSAAWQLPPWSLERVIIGAAQRAFNNLDSSVAYTSPGHTDPVFLATVAQGWQSIQVTADLGSPPAPTYVWDLLLEVAQVRLHDGGLKEGDADVEFTLTNVPLGTDTATLEQRIRENLKADPFALVDVAEELIDTTEGAADFYYYRSEPGNDAELTSDFLYFVSENDIAVDEDGQPVRPYGYAHPGFYADEALTQKVSSTVGLDGDTEHEKVKVDEDSVLFVEDDEGKVFELTFAEKPSPNRLPLVVTRVR